jgi:lipid-binding SYLF domain-containing protein
MKKLLFSFALIAALAFTIGCSERRNSASTGGAATQGVAEPKAEAVDRLNDAANILNQLVSAPDQGIPETVLTHAKCVAVVPSMIKGGFVVGGRHGRGVATCRTPNGWSAPAFFTLSGGSWGAQIGVESADVVMMFMNDKGMQDLMSSKVKLGGEASVAAGPIGRQASADTDVALKSEVLTYSRTRGLFAGLELSGAAIQQDLDSTSGFYGRQVSFRDVLGGNVPTPSMAQNFVATVQRDMTEARAANQQRSTNPR